MLTFAHNNSDETGSKLTSEPVTAGATGYISEGLASGEQWIAPVTG